MNTLPTTYTIPETAQILGLHPRTVWNYVKAGRFPARKIGGRWTISEPNLTSFISPTEAAADNTQHSAAPADNGSESTSETVTD